MYTKIIIIKNKQINKQNKYKQTNKKQTNQLKEINNKIKQRTLRGQEQYTKRQQQDEGE